MISLPTPSPDPNKYLIKIHACGTNFFDLLQIRGKYQHQPPLPWISGMEFCWHNPGHADINEAYGKVSR
jgi:NADPH:quinone reductase-like Zn-dependent oxidoreductase